MNRPARWDAWLAVTRLERNSDRSVAVGLLRPPELRDPHLSVLLDEVEVDVVALLQLGRSDVVLELGRVVPVERPLVSLFAADDHGPLDVRDAVACGRRRLLDGLNADDLALMRPIAGVARGGHQQDGDRRKRNS